MKIEKLPSGSYRIRKMYKGKTYTVVTEYKPTPKEALQLMVAELDKVQTTTNEPLTFEKASNRYIESQKLSTMHTNLIGAFFINHNMLLI